MPQDSPPKIGKALEIKLDKPERAGKVGNELVEA